jgi:D-serine deaminase-like pyridoxal phosphate-dependent protein
MMFFVTASLFVGWNFLKKLYFSTDVHSLSTIDYTVFQEFNRLLSSTAVKSNNDDPTLHHLPAVLIDLDAFDKNVAFVRQQMSAHPQITIRIASKSLRVPSLLKRILSMGAPFKGLMCYAVEEAEFLASLGFDDLLIAYPSCQPFDFEILRRLHDEQQKTVSIVVDHPKHIKALNEHMTGIKQPFPTILEYDASFRLLNGYVHIGARRSSIRTIDHLIEMIDLIEQMPFLRLEGLMVYESHIAGIGDTNPANRWLNPIIRYVKSISIPRIQQLRRDISNVCSKYGLTILNGGGTGSLTSTLLDSSVLTEITIGSGFFQPHLFDYYGQNQAMINDCGSTFIPSCYFALPIVRVSDEGEWVTCSGGGYVASGRPGWDKVPLPVFPLGLTLNDSEGPGEVQTPLRIDSQRRDETRKEFEENGIVYFRHAKAGELAERFNTFLIVAHGQLIEIAKTYRGYGKCFF